MHQEFLALLCMAAFYAIYFSKQLAQRRQGVRTNQIGRGDKTAGTLLVERLLGAATLSIVPVEAASILLGGPAGPTRFAAGLALCLVGCAVFLAAVRGLGGSWRAGISAEKDTALVTGGVYAHSRNPAFLGFDLVYLGLLLWFFNWLHLAFALFAVLMLHLQILQEEAWLGETFGAAYRSNPPPTPVFWPKTSNPRPPLLKIRRPFACYSFKVAQVRSSTGPKGRNTRPRTPGCTSSAWL